MKHDLLAAAEAAVADRSMVRKAGRRPPGACSRMILSSMTLIALLGTYVSVIRPEWIFTATPVAESPHLLEASLRLALVRERQRVEEFTKRNGRLPATLAEAGGTLTGAHLTAGAGRSFMVSAPMGAGVIELHSTDPLEAFLGNSIQAIISRPKVP
ncbi:MAG: hypothetical protein SGI84_08175 [Gemmatimonadota bacterium]|nr:hypothetical protein [Gemmatimonadota bacterium]